jgi:peptidoglycan/xylan/chitin deacetylase (PgdA/CDA1 family)
MIKPVPILMYHRIGDIPGDRITVPPLMFTEQLTFLKQNNYTTVSLADLHAYITKGKQLPPRPVILTFDDGYEDNFLNALPLLQQFAMRATVFPIAGWIGQYNDWEDYPGKPRCRTMSWEQLRCWSQAGMEVGCHTVNHPHLTNLSPAKIERELLDSKTILEAQLKIPVDFFCYPYGSFDERVKEITQQLGFRGAVAIFDGTRFWRTDLWALRRVPITRRQPIKEFALKVSAAHLLILASRKWERKIKMLRTNK